MFSSKLLICLFLLLFQIRRTYFLKLLLFIKLGWLVFFMILCHSHLTFSIQLIFPHFGSPTFPAFKEIYSTFSYIGVMLNLRFSKSLVNNSLPNVFKISVSTHFYIMIPLSLFTATILLTFMCGDGGSRTYRLRMLLYQGLRG